MLMPPPVSIENPYGIDVPVKFVVPPSAVIVRQVPPDD